MSKTIKKRSKKKCPSSDSATASASIATPSAATNNGDPSIAVSEASQLTSNSTGTAPEPKDGEPGQTLVKATTAASSGITSAPNVPKPLDLGPAPNPLIRAEAIGFLLGASIVLDALVTAKLLLAADVEVLKRDTKSMAKVLYPDFEPTPPPTKARSYVQ